MIFIPGTMIFTPEFALLGTLTALLGILSHLVIFTRIEWHTLAPLLIWVYAALAFLLFLAINSFESDLRTCLEYLFILVISYCMGLFTSITIWEGLRRQYRPIIQSGPEEIALSPSLPVSHGGCEYTCDKTVHENTTSWSRQGFNRKTLSSKNGCTYVMGCFAPVTTYLHDM